MSNDQNDSHLSYMKWRKNFSRLV